jgi:hypothetical protein
MKLNAEIVTEAVSIVPPQECFVFNAVAMATALLRPTNSITWQGLLTRVNLKASRLCRSVNAMKCKQSAMRKGV